MLNNQEIESIFRKANVLQEGHFCLTSGRHSARYMQCAQVLQYPEYTKILCKELASRFAGEHIDTVIGPAMGGIIIAFEVAKHLNARSLFAERTDGAMQLRRGFAIDEGERVLVVEDVVTTGGSVQEVIDVVKNLGGNVVGVASLVDRSKNGNPFEYKFESLMRADFETYAPEECPLCASGAPITKPGSRKTTV